MGETTPIKVTEQMSERAANAVLDFMVFDLEQRGYPPTSDSPVSDAALSDATLLVGPE